MAEGAVFARRSMSTEAFDAALRAAIDYRGDVTLHLSDASQLEGYLYDRHDDTLRILPSDGGARQSLAAASVVEVTVTGRDTAAGRSWETWVRKYLARQQERDSSCESS